MHARTINATLSTQRKDYSVLIATITTLRAVNATAQSTISFRFQHNTRSPSITLCVYEASFYWRLLYPAKSIHQAIQTKYLIAARGLCGDYKYQDTAGIRSGR